MPVSGLVVTLSNDESTARAAIAWLQVDDRFDIGAASPNTGRRLPVTLDTPNREADKASWEELQAHPGIDFIDVTCVFFS